MSLLGGLPPLPVIGLDLRLDVSRILRDLSGTSAGETSRATAVVYTANDEGDRVALLAVSESTLTDLVSLLTGIPTDTLTAEAEALRAQLIDALTKAQANPQ